MKNKLLSKKVSIKLALIGIGLIMLIGFIALAVALSDNERSNLEQELSDLTSSLDSSGYSWLINLSVSNPSIAVYEQNSDREIARFFNITQEGWHKIYLTNLSEDENYSQDVFDLRSVGDVDKINTTIFWVPYDIYLKKLRLDYIKRELKGGYT